MRRYALRSRSAAHPFLATVLLLSALALAGCPSSGATKPDGPMYSFPGDRPATALARAWFEGDGASLDVPVDADQQAPEALFVRGEYAYWQGDVEAAFEYYVALLNAAPGHALSRYAAARLAELHDDVLDFYDRVEPTLSKLTYKQLHPMTAASLATVGQRVTWNKWRRDEAAAPFDASRLGLSGRWMRSPQLGRWRLLDFDTVYPPERDASIKPKYLSPQIAQDVPENYEESRRYISSNINLSPGLGESGVYYLETFATVTAKEAQVYWVYANFPARAKVFIDGQEVLDRPEDDYETGRRLRRVKLGPGTHRVLVKFANQASYRDWFDLVLLNKDGSPLGNSALTFHEKPPESMRQGDLELLSEQALPDELEWALVKPDKVKTSSSMSLYLTALAAYENRQASFFEPALAELERRHPKLAALQGLRAAQVQSLWELPSRLRDATALKALRAGHELEPQSLHFLIKLGNWLRKKGKDDEVRVLLDTARQQAVGKDAQGEDRVRNIIPLHTWATWLQGQGWQEEAERAWQQALSLSDTNCGAATKLQRLYAGRDYYPKPSSFGIALEKCPGLVEYEIEVHPDKDQERLVLAEREAARYPYNVDKQIAWSKALVKMGQEERALEVLELASAKLPHSLTLKHELINRAYASDGPKAALARLAETTKRSGYSAWSMAREATLSDQVPLRSLMQDGPAIAKRLASQQTEGNGESIVDVLSKDEAYYAIDFAAARYLPDGSAVTLTHTMVRVMTKNAIDRFGEVTIPSGAQVLVARTIKADGSTRSPEQTVGKETLSMPGLAEGDFVELAYLDFSPAHKLSHSHMVGTRFFFRMYDISSMRSEFVVINPPGEFAQANDAPKPERFDFNGEPAVRFLRTDSPRPRTEPRIVNTEEFLPWVQLLRPGVTLEPLALRQRDYKEAIIDSLKVSAQAKRALDQWRAGLKGVSGEPKLKKLYYDVLASFPNPTSGGLGTDISHAIVTREGSPLLVLHKALEHSGFKSDLYMVKSVYQVPQSPPMIDAEKFSGPLLKVQIPGESKVYWLSPTSGEAMFNSIPAGYKDQPALCITCETPVVEKVQSQGLRDSPTQVAIESELDDQGTLKGTLSERFDGASAAYIRGVLRQRKEQTARDKLVAALLGEHMPGATVSKFTIEDEEALDAPLKFSISFERPQFARKTSSGELVIETMMFREPIASAFAQLPERVSPLFIGSERENQNTLKISLPASMSANLRSKTGQWTLKSSYGTLSREVSLKDNQLVVTSAMQLPLQRVSTAEYPKFQRWAVEVEQSAVLLMLLK